MAQATTGRDEIVNSTFSLEHFSHSLAKWTGTSLAFIIAALVIIAWIVIGYFLSYSPGWQGAVAIFTGIVSFILLFIMQRANNKELLAIQVKLNELIATERKANNNLINIEESSEEKIREIYEKHRDLSRHSTA